MAEAPSRALFTGEQALGLLDNDNSDNEEDLMMGWMISSSLVVTMSLASWRRKLKMRKVCHTYQLTMKYLTFVLYYSVSENEDDANLDSERYGM